MASLLALVARRTYNLRVGVGGVALENINDLEGTEDR